MAIIEQAKFYKDVDSAQPHCLYFIFGDESFLIEQALERFKYSLMDENTIDFNYNIFHASDVEMSTIRETVETLPVFAPRRLVIVKNCQDLKENEFHQIEDLIHKPVDSTVFVLIADKIDKRKKSFKNLIEQAHTVEFKKPYDNEIPRWILMYTQQFGLKINQEAIHRLHRLVGNNLAEVYAQLLKIKEYLGDSDNKVEIDHVNAVVSHSREESIFDFTKAVGQKNQAKALEQVIHMLDQGQNEIGIVHMLIRHMRILLQVRTGMDDGLAGTKLANQVKLSPYFIDDYCDQAKKWSIKKIEKSLLLLHETDKAMKSSPLSSHIWIENFILKACS